MSTTSVYREQLLTITGKNTTLHGEFHMEKAPMTLLGTNGSSKEVPPVMPSPRLQCGDMTLQAPDH
jgi:hypothetical protein